MIDRYPKMIASKQVYRGFIQVRRDELLYPNGHESLYDVIETRSSAVLVLGVIQEGVFLLTEEYRHPTEKTLLSLSGGYLEDLEEPLTGAKRELLEETGYVANSYRLIGSAYPYPGASGQCIFYVAALGVKKVQEPDLDPGEVVRPIILTQKEIDQKIKNQEPIDGNLLTALYLFSKS